MANLTRYIFAFLLSIVFNYVLFVLLLGLAAMSGGESTSSNIIPIIATINLIATVSLIIMFKLANNGLSVWILIISIVVPYLIIWASILNQVKYVKTQNEIVILQTQKDKSYIVSIIDFSEVSAILSKRTSKNIFLISLPVVFSDKFTDQQVANTLRFDIKFDRSDLCHFNNIPLRSNRWETYDKVITNPAGKYVFKYDYSSPYLNSDCVNSIINNKNNLIMQITKINPDGDGKDIILKELPVNVEIK